MRNKILKSRKTAKDKLKPEKPPRVSVKKEGDKEVLIQRTGLFNLKAPSGCHKKRKILGRGPGSGHGKTSTRGSKGQTSRAGRHFYLGFEGGQSPLIRKIPKRGFTSKFKKEYQILNLDDLNRIQGADITLQVLEDEGLIKDKEKLVKILGGGEIKNPVTVWAHAFSKRAKEAIANAGGKTETVNV